MITQLSTFKFMDGTNIPLLSVLCRQNMEQFTPFSKKIFQIRTGLALSMTAGRIFYQAWRNKKTYYIIALN